MKTKIFLFLFQVFLPVWVSGQHHDHKISGIKTDGVEPQPLLAQALRLQEAMSFSGNALSDRDANRLKALQLQPLSENTTAVIQQILDPYCLNFVEINPEGRIKVERGPAQALLVQGAWQNFLVKITNDAGITAPLTALSNNALKPYHSPSFEPVVKKENVIAAGQVANRFLELQMYTNRPLQKNLSGLKIEYAVVQIYSKDAGKREAEISYQAGDGSRDLAFRNSVAVLFDIKPAVKVKFSVKDDDGLPAMASFLITDLPAANQGAPTKIYPLPSKRVAAYDEYPDFFFQPQVYRKDGEHVRLAAGTYHISFTRGPEYLKQNQVVTVPAGVDSFEVSFRLKRWIHMSKLGWHSADHHIHAAGCSHYDSPEEGVKPADMWRQALGEDLNVAANLAWGPSWYYQKTFFTGKDEPQSDRSNIMRNDVEVSGFPSSHAGHIVLLKVKEDDYPNTTKIEQWPSWTAPVLSWAKSQGGLTGYAHSGWGLEPAEPTQKLPNYITPKMDGIGANEYVVTVTQDLVDFYSAGDTPAPWELNMYYHTLNCGFRTKLSGETDFPCITDARVGQARSYFKSEKAFSYDNYVNALRLGRSYVSDGKSHIMDFTVNGTEAGIGKSEWSGTGKQNLDIKAHVAAYLQPKQDKEGSRIAAQPLTEKPYWDIERARIGKTRNVKVELVINGEAVDTTEIPADGNIREVSFKKQITKSSWVTLRIFPSSHSNPVFVTIDHKPVAEKKSAAWCLAAVRQCWKMKEPAIRSQEKGAAKAAYEHAQNVYQKIMEAD